MYDFFFRLIGLGLFIVSLSGLLALPLVVEWLYFVKAPEWYRQTPGNGLMLTSVMVAVLILAGAIVGFVMLVNQDRPDEKK